MFVIWCKFEHLGGVFEFDTVEVTGLTPRLGESGGVVNALGLRPTSPLLSLKSTLTQHSGELLHVGVHTPIFPCVFLKTD